MIRISCTNCKTVLSIDDAFAGGVCRCQHCGTIQTVPISAKDPTAASVAGQSMGGSRVLAPTQSPASGLEDLAGVVVSSGLASRRLKTAAAGPSGGGPKPKSQVPLFVILGVVIVGLIGVVIFLALRPTGATSTLNQPGPTATSGEPAAPAVSNKPNFAGVDLDAPTVVYLLDRGSGTKEMFGTLKDAALKSATSLGPERKFAIVFWNNGSAFAYPDGSTTFATPSNIDAARKAIDDVSAFGASDAVPALTQALSLSPDVIVIATAKGWDLDDGWVQSMMTARGSSSVKIDAINLGSAGSGNALKSLAGKTGGTFAEVDGTALASYVGQ